jgi:hypothetical protein
MPRFIKSSYLLIFFLSALIFTGSCNLGPSQKEQQEYVQSVIEERKQNYLNITDSTKSRFNAEERALFAEKKPKYFEPDIEYKVEASFEVDTSYPVFQMPTTTERMPNYRIYGYLVFTVQDTTCKLTAYQNYDYKDHPEHGKYLFIPFKDNTNEFSTYGGGRYIDILIPDSDQVTLDFNMAYNPLCAYNDRWSCPLVPMNNALEKAIFAGEKKYK